MSFENIIFKNFIYTFLRNNYDRVHVSIQESAFFDLITLIKH